MRREGRPAWALPQLLQLAQPAGLHQNHSKLFLLARGIRALEQQEGREWPIPELKERAFLPWYTANPHLRPDQSQDVYWIEFLTAYDDVKHPLGENFLDRAWQAAESAALPAVALQFTDPEIRQLVLWCQELQRLAKDEPFFLSCRSVQGRFSLSNPTQAWLQLRGLVRFGILEEVTKGGPKGNKATRFRYLPPLTD